MDTFSNTNTPPAKIKQQEVTSAATTPIQNLPIELQNDQKRRSSSRSIKRKRFDDEIVEYSIGFPQSRSSGEQRIGRARTTSQTYVTTIAPPPLPPPLLQSLQSQVVGSPADATVDTAVPGVEVPLTSTHAIGGTVAPVAQAMATVSVAQSATSSSVSKPPLLPMERPLQLPSSSSAAAMAANAAATVAAAAASIEKRRPPRASNGGSNKKSKKTSGRPASQMTTKDLGRWKPIDDLALIIGVQQTNDLRMVHRGIKFSCKFTVQEMQSRWYSLLYEPSISRIAVAAMRNLHPELIESVQRKALFSTNEEELLGTIKSTDNPKLDQFQDLLVAHASVFYGARTAKSLQNHWQQMKQYQLLPDQIVKPLHISDQPLSFSDAEDLILDTELSEQRDESLEIELSLADRQHKREIRLLENELTRWNVLIDSITSGVGSAPEFDGQTLAVLRGRLVRYLMRSKEISFGRDAKDCVVDVDLSLEGPACKISRRQGTIKLRSNGDFFIANEGRRPIFIDGVPLLMGNKTRLANNCVVEICGLRFVFLVNYELINAIRHESAKTTSPLN